MSEYGLSRQEDFTSADLEDKSGWTDRKCPECGSWMYNDTDIENEDFDFCEQCGRNCVD